MTNFYGARPDRTSPFGRIATGCIPMYPDSLTTPKTEKGVRFVMVITLYLWLIIVDLWILVLAQTWCIEHCKKALPAIRLATVHCQSLEPRRGSLARWGFPLLRKSWPKRKLEELMAQGDVDDTPKAGSEFGKATWQWKRGGGCHLKACKSACLQENDGTCDFCDLVKRIQMPHFSWILAPILELTHVSRYHKDVDSNKTW